MSGEVPIHADRLHPDVLVIGAGGSGAALAARLSEDPGRSVLLVEAGPVPRRLEDFPAELLDAGSVRGADPGHPDNWAYPANLTRDRPYSIARGRIAGGSTAINGAYFERARRPDFERWSQAAGPMWSYEAALPLMRGLENDLDFGATPLHGGTGPMPVSRALPDSPVVDAVMSAALTAGYPDEPDKNGEQQDGVGPVPRNAQGGLRVNTAIAYLLPALEREGLRVDGGITVHRILASAGRVRGIEATASGHAVVIEADEVVLCAGAFGSAQILLASGIGGDAVGAGFSDHPQLVLEWGPTRALPRSDGAWMAPALNIAGPDLHGELLPSVISSAALLGAPETGTAPLPVYVADLTPRRRGRVRLDSSGELRLDYGYLDPPADLARLRELTRIAAGLIDSPDFGLSAGLVGIEGTTLRHDDDLDDWIRGHLGTSLHSCGTIPFGPEGDPDAVVDGYGRVYGVDGLRVADVSILPTAPTRGPAATAVLIGELVADAMRRGL